MFETFHRVCKMLNIWPPILFLFWYYYFTFCIISGAVWMEDAQLSNIIYSHPEDRNAHNSVFGGYLMRQALELSWACCYQFTKSRYFRLMNINDITFSSPVPGNLVLSHSNSC